MTTDDLLYLDDISYHDAQIRHYLHVLLTATDISDLHSARRRINLHKSLYKIALEKAETMAQWRTIET